MQKIIFVLSLILSVLNGFSQCPSADFVDDFESIKNFIDNNGTDSWSVLSKSNSSKDIRQTTVNLTIVNDHLNSTNKSVNELSQEIINAGGFTSWKLVQGVGNALRKIDDFIPSSGTQLIGNTNKTTTILGRWVPDMQVVQSKMLPNEFNVGTEFGSITSNNGGFNFLNIPDNLANASSDFFNQYNKPWLQKAIKRGDEMVLATKPINKSDFIAVTGELKGMYAEELKFLVQQNYKPANLSVSEWNTIKTWFP